MTLKTGLMACLIAGALALPMHAITCCEDYVNAGVIPFGNCVRDVDECEDTGGRCGERRRNACNADVECADQCLTFPVFIVVYRISPCDWDEVEMACECAGNYTVTWALQVGCAYS